MPSARWWSPALIAFLVNWQMQSAIDDQNERNQYLKTEIAELDKQIAEILELEQQKQRLLARMQVIEQLERSRPEIVHVFDQLVRTMPDGIYLTSVKQTDRKIQLKGIAQSSTRVASYMRNIDSSEWMTDPGAGHPRDQGRGRCRFGVHAEREPGESAGSRRTPRRNCRSDERERPDEQHRRSDSRSRPERSGPLAAAVPARRDWPHFPDRRGCARRISSRGSRRSRNWTRRAREERRCSARCEQKARKAANLDAYKAQLAEMEQSFGAMLRKLPNKTEVPNLLTDISQQGSGAGLDQKLFQPSSADQQGLLRRAADQDAPDRHLSMRSARSSAASRRCRAS